MILIDKLCYTSKLRYKNAGEKFFFSLAALCFCIVSKSVVLALFVLAAAAFLSVFIGGVSFRRYLRLMTIPSMFLLLTTLTVILQISRTPMDAFALSFSGFYLTGSFTSIFQGLQLMLTALASVSCLYFLALSTPLTDILSVLRALRLPRLIAELMILIYRFIFILLETASAITLSANSRLGNRNFRTSMRSFGLLSSALFIQAMRRSNALYDAMEARCYNGELRMLTEHHPPVLKEILYIIFFELLLLLLTVLKWKGVIL